MDFLIDPSSGFYLLLIATCAVTAGLWFRSQKRSDAINLGIAAAVLLAVFVLDSLFESGREQAVRRVIAMRDAVNAQQSAALLEHVSGSFQIGNSDKARLGHLADQAFREGYLSSMTVWDFDRSGVVEKDGTVTIVFKVKPHGDLLPKAAFYGCRAAFVRDADGAWRMQTFQLFNPAVKTEDPVAVPGL